MVQHLHRPFLHCAFLFTLTLSFDTVVFYADASVSVLGFIFCSFCCLNKVGLCSNKCHDPPHITLPLLCTDNSTMSTPFSNLSLPSCNN